MAEESHYLVRLGLANEGERMYVLRVDNKLVHLSKEKILGSVP